MKLSIVCDWLPTYGGAEHVIAALHRVWPKAPIHTTVINRSVIEALKAADVRPTWLQTLYRIVRKHQLLLPLMPRALEDIDFTGTDVIISSSHAVGKGIVPPSTAVHICYCHTPMRYAWEMEEAYLNDFRLKGWLRSRVKRELKRLRRWDLSTAKRVDWFIANSHETAGRIKRIYGRDSIVIPPPVDDLFFSLPVSSATDRTSFIAVGRLVPYKRFDLLIELANKLNLDLLIVGTGQEESRLKAMAGPSITFAGYVPDPELPALYSKAKALLFPQYEDAGIVPLEAQACGTPVIAYGRGGVLDSVKDGISGIFVKDQSVEDFTQAIRIFGKKKWDHEAIRKHAERFSEKKFGERMREEIERVYAKNKRR